MPSGSTIPALSKKSKKIGKYTVGKLISKSKYKIKQIFVDEMDNPLAIKLFKSRGFAHESKIHWQREKLAYSKLSHPNIIRMLDCFEYQKSSKYLNIVTTNYVIVLEYCEKMDLYEYVEKTGRFPEGMAKAIIRKIIKGLEYMHANNFVHLDLKLENIFLDSNFEIKIGDFDTCREGDNLLEREFVGTMGYHAPEILERRPFDGKKVDVFTLGVMLFIMCAGIPPFVKATSRDPRYQNLKTNKTADFWKEWQTVLGFKFSTEFEELVTSLMSYDPNKRPELAAILSSEWMKGGEYDEESYIKEFEARYNEIAKLTNTIT